MKTLTPEERARRAAVLGVTLPAPPAAAAPRPKLTLKKPPAAAPVTLPPKPEPPPEPAETKRQRCQRVRNVLSARYPIVFSAARPMAVGIDEQIRETMAGEIVDRDLKLFFEFWVNRPPYRAALARGDRRVNLDGTDAGPAFAEPGTTYARTPSLGERAQPPTPAPASPPAAP